MFTRALDIGSHINARAQRRGQNPHKPLTEPRSCRAPLAPRPLQWVVRRAYRQIHATVGKLCKDEETLEWGHLRSSKA
jgi:hypothetical protein